MTDLETMLRVTASPPHSPPAKPRKREIVLMAIFVALLITSL